MIDLNAGNRNEEGKIPQNLVFTSWGPRVGRGGMWILWPKKTGSIPSDLTQQDVRRAGLDHGLVDFKICAFDADWSGLKFSVRK